MAHYKFRLLPQTHQQWTRACKTQGVPASVALRWGITRALQDAAWAQSVYAVSDTRTGCFGRLRCSPVMWAAFEAGCDVQGLEPRTFLRRYILWLLADPQRWSHMLVGGAQ